MEGAAPERTDGLRAWVAQLDRKVGVRTYGLAAATVLALAAGIVALVLVLETQEDAATTDELSTLGDQLDRAKRSASRAAREDVRSLNHRLEALEAELTGVREQQRIADRRIAALRADIRDVRPPPGGPKARRRGGSGGAGG